MNLLIENPRNPRAFEVELGDEMVGVSHFSVFDHDTDETDSLSLSFAREDFDQGIQDLNANGACRNRRKHGDLELTVKGDGTLSAAMIGRFNRIYLQGLRFRIEASPPVVR